MAVAAAVAGEDGLHDGSVEVHCNVITWLDHDPDLEATLIMCV